MTRRCFVSYVSTVRYIVGCFPVVRSSSTNSFSFLPPIVPRSSLVLLHQHLSTPRPLESARARSRFILIAAGLLVGEPRGGADNGARCHNRTVV